MNNHVYPYMVQFTEGGVFFDVWPGMDTDESSLQPALVVFDLQRRHIIGLKQGDFIVKLRQKKFPIRIADTQEEAPADACPYVQISKDGMQAVLHLLPPTAGGKRITAEDMIAQISGVWGVAFGLDEGRIREAALLDLYYRPVVIAEGKPPIPGRDGRLSFFFEVSHNKMPRMRPDGSMDYKSLDLFTTVRKGDQLVARIPPEEGIPGVSVQGAGVPAKAGKNVAMPRPKNAYLSEDGNSMFADRDGRAEYAKGLVEVSDQFLVHGNADMSVGNVNFPGDIRIYGGVISGLVLQAGGNIEVDEPVECAMLIAGNDIILKKGVQGMDKALLKAGGNVVSRFIERCVVEAQGSIFSDYIVHSNVTAGNAVILKGKHSRLIGGRTRAVYEVYARTIGTPTGEKTLVEVGSLPAMRNELNAAMESLMQSRAQLEKIDNLLRMYIAKKDMDELQEQWEKLLAGRTQLAEKTEEEAARIQELKERLAAASNGKVHVPGEAYQDVKIIINSLAYILRETVQYATFKCREGEIVFSACESGERG